MYNKRNSTNQTIKPPGELLFGSFVSFVMMLPAEIPKVYVYCTVIHVYQCSVGLGLCFVFASLTLEKHKQISISWCNWVSWKP